MALMLTDSILFKETLRLIMAKENRVTASQSMIDRADRIVSAIAHIERGDDLDRFSDTQIRPRVEAQYA